MPTGVYERKLKSPEERFWAFVEKTPACWNWLGATNGFGYGRFSATSPASNKLVLVHRFSFELIHGKVANDMDLDHLCRNRRCVNPSHLEKVSRSENLLRSELTLTGANARKTHCVRGHSLTDAGNLRMRDGVWRCCRTCAREDSVKARKKRILLAQGK